MGRVGGPFPEPTLKGQQGEPCLPAALQACVDAGARRILVAPVFVPVDRSLRIWVPKIIRRWLRRRRGVDVDVVLADALGDHPALGEAVAQTVLDAEAREDVRTGTTERHDLGSPGWAVIPAHRYHALFCTGPRCATQGRSTSTSTSATGSPSAG